MLRPEHMHEGFLPSESTLAGEFLEENGLVLIRGALDPCVVAETMENIRTVITEHSRDNLITGDMGFIEKRDTNFTAAKLDEANNESFAAVMLQRASEADIMIDIELKQPLWSMVGSLGVKEYLAQFLDPQTTSHYGEYPPTENDNKSNTHPFHTDAGVIAISAGRGWFHSLKEGRNGFVPHLSLPTETGDVVFLYQHSNSPVVHSGQNTDPATTRAVISIDRIRAKIDVRAIPNEWIAINPREEEEGQTHLNAA